MNCHIDPDKSSSSHAYVHVMVDLLEYYILADLLAQNKNFNVMSKEVLCVALSQIESVKPEFKRTGIYFAVLIFLAS